MADDRPPSEKPDPPTLAQRSPQDDGDVVDRAGDRVESTSAIDLPRVQQAVAADAHTWARSVGDGLDQDRMLLVTYVRSHQRRWPRNKIAEVIPLAASMMRERRRVKWAYLSIAAGTAFVMSGIVGGIRLVKLDPIPWWAWLLLVPAPFFAAIAVILTGGAATERDRENAWRTLLSDLWQHPENSRSRADGE